MKPPELPPPPTAPTLSELEDRFTDTLGYQPSTSEVREQGDTAEVIENEKKMKCGSCNLLVGQKEAGKSVQNFANTFLTDKPLGDFAAFNEKIVGCDQKLVAAVSPGTKKEENMENVVFANIPVDGLYPSSAAFQSHEFERETTKVDDSAESISYEPGIYPSMQLKEMTTASAPETDELMKLTYSGEVHEGSTADISQPPSISLKIQSEVERECMSNMYPSLSLEYNECGLLTESQLLAFYQNSLYETVEDFLDDFLKHEEFPQYELHEYLKRYKDVCEHIDTNEIDVTQCEQMVKECAQASWTAENRVIKQEGRCGEQKYATGSATYLLATFHPEKATELSRLLKRDASLRLDSSLSLQIQMRSLALQIQWHITAYNDAFMMEHCCSTDSPQCFLPGDSDTVSRRNLRRSLSDLFHFLRYPNLSLRFTTAVSGWISELVAVLLKACTSYDQQYLLCQVLRLVSPVSQWAAPLLQSYVEVDSINDRLVIDHYIAMMSLLLSSIRGRENFLRRVTNFERANNSWVVLSDDGVEEDESVVTISETDLIAFLNQFNAEAVFAKAIRCFAITSRLDPINQALALIAFELLLIKIFNDGLHNYGILKYRQFCKQIGYALRQSVICSAEFLKIVKNMLSFDETELVQKEFDRIVLHALYYVVSKQNLGLLQFVVDLPYGVVSEACRMRCQILLRRRMIPTVSQLYEFPEEDLPHLVETAGSLPDKLPDLPSDDRIYMISALAAVISASGTGVDSFTVEILDVCFLDISMRDHFYKVGAETIGILIDKHPHILHKILLVIDRNLDALDEYAVEILSLAPLSKCRLSADDVGVICGKWLINKPPSHPASRIAKRMLGSMNWGTDRNGKLWLDPDVHTVCADTLVKGHMAQCKATNGLISKSWNKVAKLALKVPDFEHQFDAFCWDILIRLKLPPQTNNLSIYSVSDLASFFVFIIQRSLLSVDEFLSSGLSLWSELITSGCYAASVVILARLVSSFPDTVTLLISQTSFTQCFDRLLLCDQSSYATQLLTGADKFPNRTIRLLGSAIAYHMTENFSKIHLDGWIKLLCCKRPTQWNTDKSTLYLLGILIHMAFLRDQIDLMGIPELLKINYALLVQQWKDGSKGVLSWFTNDDTVPPLIDSRYLSISPWASYALLLAEQRFYETFYEALYQAMSKHPENGLDQSVKKAVSKSHTNISIERLHFHRWLQFACSDNVKDHPIFPLILQNLAIHLYSRKILLDTKFCYGEKYLRNSSSKPLFEELREKILLQVERSNEKDISSFYKAFAQWLSNPKICSISFRAFEDILLDHLLQFIVASDFHPWLEYVNMNKLRKQINEEQKLYIFACHLGSLVPSSTSTVQARNFTQLITQLSKRNRALPCPVVLSHPTLPREIPFDLLIACDRRHCLTPFAAHLREINNAARVFVRAKDQVETLDEEYVNYYPDLYTKSATELSIILKCATSFGNKCAHPTTSSVIVAASKYQISVEAKMKTNRQKRSNELAGIYSKLFEQTSLNCAHLENIALKMYNHVKNIDDLSTTYAKLLRDAGRILFYHSTSSITSLEMIFPAAAVSYEYVLAKLGKAFIANNPKEQHNLMRVILSGSHLTHLLISNFTPHCVPSTKLLDLYSSLSKAVRDPVTSPAALALLSQLDIKNAGDRLPPHQFSQLMPAAFENLISISDNSLPLYDICRKHFIHSLFHRFPNSFVDGLKLSLAACDSKSTPLYIFDEIISKLGAKKIGDIDAKPEYIIDAMTSVAASEAVAVQFRKSRNELSTRLYSVWSIYLPKVLNLAQFFLYSAASLSFDSEQCVAKLESELRQVFESCVQVFGPLLEPFGYGLPPWNPADAESAAVVLDYFVSLMEQIHVLYDAYFPPGSENLVTLFWRYYAGKLAFLSRGGPHVHQIIESRFINIPWHLFWPSLCDLASMDKIMVSGAPESAPLITQIVVRIPWFALLQHQAQQPLDACRLFYSLLFSLLSNCISRPSSYAVCRASLPKLMNSLGSFSWHLIDIEQLNAVSSRIASNFSSVVLTDPNDVTNAFFELYRHVCFLETTTVDIVSAEEVCQKQAFYIRTQLALMLRNSTDRTWLSQFYEKQIKDVHNIVSSAELPSESHKYLSRELISFWSDISDSKFLEIFVSALLQWLPKNTNSPVVLLLMNTTLRAGLCEWRIVLEWIVLPDHCEQVLFTLPSSESTLFFFPLCANAFVTKQLLSLTSIKNVEVALLEQETSLLRTLFDFVTTTKPRYVTSEAAFLLLMAQLQNLLLRQCNYSVAQGNQFLSQYLEWLERAYGDDKSSSFFSLIGLSKKQPYSIRMRYICHLMNLYISQQIVAPNQAPRNTVNALVLNSRIQAFKELCSHKQYASFQSTSQLAQPYFIQVQNHHIGHMNELFGYVVRSLYNEKYLEGIIG
uniref:Uncharacterized protein n=1 Tax=Setaria digitata TaxID=48799 RepID=A0A915PW17_9BILA